MKTKLIVLGLLVVFAVPAFAQLDTVRSNKNEFSIGYGVKPSSSFRYNLGHHYDPIEEHVGAIFATFEGLGAVSAVLGPHYLAVAQVNERPQLGIHPKDNVTAPAAVAAVRSAFGNIFSPVQMGAAGAAVATGAKNAYVVYEVTFCHAVICFGSELV